MIVEVNSGYGIVAHRYDRLFHDTDDPVAYEFGDPESLRIWHFLQEKSGAGTLRLEALDVRCYIVLHDVVAEDDSHRVAFAEVLAEFEGIGDAALALLIGIV